MLRLHLADSRIAPRQVLARGRVAERITGRGLAGLAGRLLLGEDAAALRPLPARFEMREEGFFAFSLVPSRDMPDLSAAAAVTLRAEFRRDAADPILAERVVPGSALALREVPRRVAGRELTALVVAEAPFDLSAEADPPAVALAGIVLRNHDPSEPVAGVTVTAGAASAVTDAGGRFVLSTLPLAEVVPLELEEDGDTITIPHRVDYAWPVNTVTLSLPD